MTYDYRCTECGDYKEFRLKVEERHDPPKTVCLRSLDTKSHCNFKLVFNRAPTVIFNFKD